MESGRAWHSSSSMSTMAGRLGLQVDRWLAHNTQKNCISHLYDTSIHDLGTCAFAHSARDGGSNPTALQIASANLPFTSGSLAVSWPPVCSNHFSEGP